MDLGDDSKSGATPGNEDIDLDDEDFDLGELDDDLGDESWDDFDDEEVEKSSKSKAKTKDPVDRSLPPPKKSGLGKMVTPLIILAVLGGAGYFYLTFMSQPVTAPPAQTGDTTGEIALGTPEEDFPLPGDDLAPPEQAPLTNEEPELAVSDESAPDPLDSLGNESDFPPMPAPISSAQDQDVESLQDFPPMDNATGSEPDVIAEPEDTGLTPLPPETGLEDLDLTGLENLPVSDTPPPPVEPPAEPIADMSAPPEIPDLEALPSFPLPDADTTAETPSQPEDELLAMPGTEDGLPQEAPADALMPADTVEAPTAEPAPTEETVVPEISVEDADSLSPDIAAQLETENESLKTRLEDANGKISSLNQTVEELKAQIQSLESKAAATDTAASPPPKPAAARPKTAAKTPVRVQESSWTLRSAQPGKAVLSPKGSDDMRTIEVGDNISGLGTIQTIDIINGKWVVQGSRGSVSR